MSDLTKAQKTMLVSKMNRRDSQLRDELYNTLQQSEDQKYIDLSDEVHDLGEESIAHMLTELSGTLAERHLAELHDIAAARRRLLAGDINHCAECGRDIGLKRLLANLTAVRCIDCQRRYEAISIPGVESRL